MTEAPPTPEPGAATGTPLPAGATPQRMQVPPWVQMVGLPVVVVFTYILARAASHALIVFLIAALISLLLAPVVRALVASGIPRLASVLLVFGMFASIVTVLAIGAVNVVAGQATEIRDNAQSIGDASVNRIDDLQHFVDHRGWNIDLRNQGVRFVNQLETRSTELSSSALDFGRQFVTIIAEAAFNLILVIVITIYMLLDAPRISRFLSSMLPASSGIDQLHGRLQRSLLRYTIGQTLASLVMGVSATVALVIIGRTGLWDAAGQYAVLFGVIVAVTEFAPSIGPVIGAVPPILTAAFDGIGPAITVTLLFLLLHQIEGHIVIPKLMGAAIAVHPLLVIFGILAGAQMFGIGGVLLALPMLAVGREIVLFIRERVAFGSWAVPPPVATAGGVRSEGAVSEWAAGAIEDTGSMRHVSGRRRAALGSRLRTILDLRHRRRRGPDDSSPTDDAGHPPDGGRS